ncbi:MAG: fasciclin domain-containing protein [Propionibacteriaceae bacterium]
MTTRARLARPRRTRAARIGAVLAVTVATAFGSLAAAAPSADATSGGHHGLGTRSLAAVLATDGSGFDRNWNDYDITDHAVQAVLAAKPHSAVAVLADGTTPVTAFLPTDRAFRKLAEGLTHRRYSSEKAVFTALATTLGVNTIESVLLYHVVPGQTITYRTALRANGAKLDTALAGSTVTVKVRRCFVIRLVDADPDARNPYVVQADINKGNRQIAHGIDRVLRPVDL